MEVHEQLSSCSSSSILLSSSQNNLQQLSSNCTTESNSASNLVTASNLNNSTNDSNTSSQIIKEDNLKTNNYPSEDYEKRFLNSLKNLNSPKWLNTQSPQLNNLNSQKNISNYANILTNTQQSLTLHPLSKPIPQNPTISYINNTKNRYYRIRLKSKQQSNNTSREANSRDYCYKNSYSNTSLNDAKFLADSNRNDNNLEEENENINKSNEKLINKNNSKSLILLTTTTTTITSKTKTPIITPALSSGLVCANNNQMNNVNNFDYNISKNKSNMNSAKNGNLKDEMKRSFSNYTYYNSSSTSSLKPKMSLSNYSLANNSSNSSSWYKPKNLELPKSKTSLNNSVIMNEISDSIHIEHETSTCCETTSSISATVNNSDLNEKNTNSYFIIKEHQHFVEKSKSSLNSTNTIQSSNLIIPTTYSTSLNTTNIKPIPILRMSQNGSSNTNNNNNNNNINKNNEKSNRDTLEDQTTITDLSNISYNEATQMQTVADGILRNNELTSRQVINNNTGINVMPIASSPSPRLVSPTDTFASNDSDVNDLNVLNYSSEGEDQQQHKKLLKDEPITQNRSNMMVTRLEYRNDELPSSNSNSNEKESDQVKKEIKLDEAAASAVVAESYDNINVIDSSDLIDEEECDIMDDQEDQFNILINANNNLNELDISDDFQNKYNTKSFIFANPKSNRNNNFASNNDFISSSFTKSENGDDQPQLAPTNNKNKFDDNGLRNYDDDYRQSNDEDDQFAGSNEDEFFLISTPSPFNLASAAAARIPGTSPQSFQLIEPSDEDYDDFNNRQQPQIVMRYQPQYEMNRLSNITEEEDDTSNLEEEDHVVVVDDKNKEINNEQQSGKMLADEEQKLPDTVSIEMETDILNEKSDLDQVCGSPINELKPPLEFSLSNETENNKKSVATVVTLSTDESFNNRDDTKNEFENSSFLDKSSVDSYKEILILGEQVSSLYKNIENELTRPILPQQPQPQIQPTATVSTTVDYKPLMKKRVYNINSLATTNYNPSSSIPTETISYNLKPLNQNLPSISSNLLSTKLTRTFNENSNSINAKEEENIKMASSNQSEEEEPDSILNYLIGRLSEQHKSKLDNSKIVAKENLKNESDSSLVSKNVNNEFEDFEKKLFEKYAIPQMDQKATSSNNDTTQIEDSNDKSLTLSKLDTSLLESYMPRLETEETSNYLLTKSLYAQHKKINLNNNETRGDNIKLKQNSSSCSNDKNKMITALSINEIETRKLFNIKQKGDVLNENIDCIEFVDKNKIDDEENSSNDEKKIKEEIVLIGEKSDIDSLLDNENNQLYNLILANSNRTTKLTALENDLNKKRIEIIKNNEMSKQEDKNINILIGTENSNEQQNAYENDLKDTAKYLVDEITKISLNKLKIDDLSDRLDKKYFSSNLLTKHEILNSLVDSNNNDNTNRDMDSTFFEMNQCQPSSCDLSSSVSKISSTINNKNREELFDYYSNLEKNLEQVRNEIDKLKREAYDDLAYISEILSDEKPQNEDLTMNDLIDYDQVYLNNNEDDTIMNIETGRQIDQAIQEQIYQDTEITRATEDDGLLEDEEEEETEYLTQPTSAASTVTPKVANNIQNSGKDQINNRNDNNSQVFMTPAESWQTLVNNSNEIQNKNFNEQKLFSYKQMIMNNNEENNQTDLDEDFDYLANDYDELLNKNETKDDVTLKIQLSPNRKLQQFKQHQQQQTSLNQTEMKSIEVKQINKINQLIEEEKVVFTKRNDDSNSSDQIILNEVITSLKNKAYFTNETTTTTTKMTTIKPQSHLNYGDYPDSGDIRKNSNDENEIPLTQLVKNILARPTIPAPRLCNGDEDINKTIIASSYSSYDLSNNKGSQKPTSLVINRQSEMKTTTITSSSTSQNRPIVNTRSRSTGPISKPKTILHQQSHPQPVVILEKSSLDKFLKLASNSASQLDLNQAHLVSLSTSNGKLKTSSNNLLSLCGADSNANLNSSNKKINEPEHLKKSQQTISTSSGQETLVTVIDKKQTIQQVAVQKNLSVTNSYNNNGLRLNASPTQLSTTSSNNTATTCNTIINKNNETENSAINERKANQSNNFNVPIIKSQSQFSKQISTNLNLNSNKKQPVKIKKENEINEAITSNIMLAKLNSTSQATPYRVPSSRHFCGRLLSSNFSTASTNSSTSCSNSSSSPQTSDKNLKDKKYTAGSEEDEEEIYGYEEDEYANNQQESPKIVLKPPPPLTQRTIKSSANDNRRDRAGNDSPLEILSTSSPSTSSSSPNSSSPQPPPLPLNLYNIQQQRISNNVIPNQNVKNGYQPEVQRRSISSSNSNYRNQSRPNVNQNEIKRDSYELNNNKNMNNHPKNSSSIDDFNTQNPSRTLNNRSVMQTSITNGNNQMKKSNTLNYVQDKSLTINNKYDSQKDLLTSNNVAINNRSKSQLAKSVEHLLPSEEKKMLVKQIDLNSQKDISNILLSNSRQMTLSKSIKDLRLFVSNSFSPSQIVRPPLNNQSAETVSNNIELEKSNNDRVLDEINQNSFNYQSKLTASSSKPQLQTQQSINSINKEKPLPQTKLNLYTDTMLKPLKDEKSDQVRIEFLQQQALLNKIQKQQAQEHIKQQQQQQQQHQQYSTRQLNRDERDDALLNCILDMKPMPANIQQPIINKNVSSNIYTASKERIIINKNNNENDLNKNYNKQQLKQDSSIADKQNNYLNYKYKQDSINNNLNNHQMIKFSSSSIIPSSNPNMLNHSSSAQVNARHHQQRPLMATETTRSRSIKKETNL